MNAPSPISAVAVSIDGRPHLLPAGATLAELVTTLGHTPDGVGTAVNGLFVPRGQRPDRQLADGDAVLLFRPIGGG